MWCDDIGKVGVAMDRNEPESGVVANTPVVGYDIFCVNMYTYIRVCVCVCVCVCVVVVVSLYRCVVD